MIHFVIGTRAQLFKMAPIMLECEQRKLKWRWIYAAQHKETIDETLNTFRLRQPDYTVISWDTEANTMPKYFYWFGRIMLSLFQGRKILDSYTGKKHFVLTHGDTSTTLWGALLGRLYRTRVMHVESGLRSFNLFEPFPEELNRIFTFWLSDIYACPGEWALGNVQKYKGVKFNTYENTQVDTIRFGLQHCDSASIKVPKEKYVVVSTHRYENVYKKERFEKIISTIEKVADDFKVLIVQHPVTKKKLEQFGFTKRLEKNKNINLLPRLEYLPFIKLIKHSEFVMTDGGGNQEELYHIGKPTLLLRNSTERNEGLNGNAILSKLDEKIINRFIQNYQRHKRTPSKEKHSPSKIIVDKIQKLSTT